MRPVHNQRHADATRPSVCLSVTSLILLTQTGRHSDRTAHLLGNFSLPLVIVIVVGDLIIYVMAGQCACVGLDSEILKPSVQLQATSSDRTSPSGTKYAYCTYVIETRRPASADRTARRQFQATGLPVSRTQTSDAMTSRLPRYEAKYVCNAGASDAGWSLCVQISREWSYPLPIY